MAPGWVAELYYQGVRKAGWVPWYWREFKWWVKDVFFGKPDVNQAEANMVV
jgi:hypothetical protein